MFIFIHNLIIIIVDINPPCILILIKVGWAPLSRDGQGVELCRESTNFHPTPHWAWTTILMYHTTYTPIPHFVPPPHTTPHSSQCHTSAGCHTNLHQLITKPGAGTKPTDSHFRTKSEFISTEYFNLYENLDFWLSWMLVSKLCPTPPISIFWWACHGSKLAKLLPMHQLWKIWPIHHRGGVEHF